MQNKTQGRERGYTLLEIMIVVALLAGAVVGVLRLFAMGSVKAATQREQTSINALVDAVRGVYASSPSYAGITMSTVEQQARLDQVLRANGQPVSAFGGTLTLSAATIAAPDDAFAIRINPLDAKACAALVPALAGQTARVSTTSGGNIQAKPGVVPNGADIAKACAGAFFQKSQGALTLVYYSPRAQHAARPGPSCAQSCAPQTQTQTLTCPTGLVGQINQTRNGTCSAGACPSQVWSPWTTVSSSCAVAPAPPLPIVPTPTTDPAQSCVPRTETRSIGCPQPQLGRIDQTQAITCDAGGSAHVGAWTTVGNTCVAPPMACTDGVLTGVDACAASEFGQVSWIKEMTCTGGGLMIGPKVITGSSCATIGTCRPSRAPDGQKNVACASGEFGQVIQTLEKTSTCSSATALPIWGPDTVISSTGACAACPVPKTETQSVPCPVGQVGLITQSRSVSYACASAPTSLPAPTYSAWTTTSNTCVIATCTPSGGGVWSVNVISMQVGPIGGTPTSTPYDTVTFNPSTGIAYMQTAPTTSRFLASGNVVFDLTVGAQTQQFTVACTQGNSTLNSAGSHITDECLYTGAVTLNGVTLNVTVDASGLPQQDYVNGKPAGPAAVQATFAQGGGCTNPAATACVPYGNGVANGITVTPIDLKLDGLGDKGAVLGAYGSTAVAAAPTGTASFQISYKGDTQTVNVACDATNNTSGGTVACQGTPVPITVGGSAFLASLNTNGPFLDQGLYWDASVSVSQNCLHWILAGTDIVQTNVMNATTPVSGQGTEIPNQDVVPTNGPITWVIPVNDRIGSGDGPGPNIDPNNSWNGFLNMTGSVPSVPWNTQNNPGYGNPTNPWASMYASGNYKVYAGPTASQYGTNVVTSSPACTQGANTMFATQWGFSYPMQLLYDGFTCGIGQVTTFAGSSGSPQPPPTGCVKSAAARKILSNGSASSTPMMLPPPGC